MSSKWADAVMQGVIFDNAHYGPRVNKLQGMAGLEDEAGKFTASNKRAWRTRFISAMSLLHGVALADLQGEDMDAVPVLEGIDRECHELLNQVPRPQGPSSRT